MATTTQLRRAVTSSFLGSVIEYYDFLLYATASAVVFNKVFFSSLDPLVGTIASFGTFATGYLARPLGGVLFGHFGDVLGRKKMLVLTMSLMGVASFLIGLLPTYAQVGWLAPAGLVLLRVVQVRPRELMLVDALDHLLVGIIRVRCRAVRINRDEGDALRSVL